MKRRTANAVQNTGRADVNDQLMKMLGESGTKRKLPLWLFLIGGAVLIGIGLGIYFLWPRGQAASTEVVYREYTVERGDVTVGQSESSSVSLTRESVVFPASAAVEEVYVKAGSSVKIGDPLVKLNLDDITTSMSSYELQLEMAGLSLEKAKLDMETKLLTAEQKLETSKETGSLAGESKYVTLAELESTLSKAKTTLATAMEELTEYTGLSATFTSDYNRLNNLESALQSAKDTVTSLQTQVNNATDYGSLLTTAKTELNSSYAALNSAALNAQNDSSFTVIGAPVNGATNLAATIGSYYSMSSAAPGNLTGTDPNAKTDIEAWITAATAAGAQNLVTNLNSMLSALSNMDRQAKNVRDYTNSAQGTTASQQAIKDQLTSAQSNQSSYQEIYDEFKTYYNERYGNVQDAEELADKIISLEADVTTAQINLDKAYLSAETGETSAEQKEETARTEANNAATTYELTEMELQQSVDAAQEAYDNLVTQINDAKELITGDGTLYATCNGMVASVNVEAGDEVSVTLDTETMRIGNYAQILTMTNITNVYVPITISEEDILSVSIGQNANVTMTAFPGRTFAATVDTISVESSRAGAATISYNVTIRFAEENTLDMYEGMTAAVTLVQRTATNVLYVANQAVTNVDGVSTVLIQGTDGSPVELVVKTGFSDGRYVEILEGLSEGDVVLAESAVGRQ